MKPSTVLLARADEVQLLLRRHQKLNNLRVFGSVARGDDREDSDIDFLVDPAPGTTLLDLSGLREELQALFGSIHVDLLTPRGLPKHARALIESEARPI